MVGKKTDLMLKTTTFLSLFTQLIYFFGLIFESETAYKASIDIMYDRVNLKKKISTVWTCICGQNTFAVNILLLYQIYKRVNIKKKVTKKMI